MEQDQTTKKEEKTSSFADAALQAMADAGVFFGRKKSRTHPRMRQFIFCTRNNTEIIDLHEVKKSLESAKKALYNAASTGGLVLFVGTQPAAREVIGALAEKYDQPYVLNRWIGGTLTNFKVISKRIEALTQGRADVASGALDKYTKKERLEFNKGLNRLENILSGLVNLTKLPEALFIVNINEHETAVLEARKLGIPIIALVGTASDPELVTHSIPANDSARGSIEFICGELEESLREGLAKAEATPTEVSTEAPKPEAAG